MTTPQVPYCSAGPCDNSDDSLKAVVNDNSERPAGAANAYVIASKLWIGRTALKVYFMNPSELESWKVGKHPMNPDNIIGWAQEWNTALAKNIPRFEREDSMAEADIRVRFGSKLLLQ